MDHTTKLIASRLRELRESREWTIDHTVKLLSEISNEPIIRSRYSNWENGIRKPRSEQVHALAKLFDVPAAYIAGLTSDNGSAPAVGEYSVPNQQLVLTARGLEPIDQADDGIALKNSLLEELKLDRNKIMLVRVSDDSMGGLIKNGDRVLVDLSRTEPTGGDLFAILVNGRIVIRWITDELTGGYLIRAENQDRYQNQHITADDIGKIQIIGRVSLIVNSR